MELIETTERARYWRTVRGFYRATPLTGPMPTENGGGWVLLDELKKAKGEPQ